jgi:hypothetical protein
MMRNNNQKNIDSLVSKILSETLEERADNLVSRLKHKEVNELGGMEDGHPKFGDKNFSEMSSDEIADLLKNYNDDDSDFEDNVDEYSNDDDTYEYEDDDFDNELSEGDSEMCECGGKLYEGTCNECGGSYGSMDEEEEFGDDNSEEDRKTCEFHREHFGEDDERTQRFCKTMNESLKGNQKRLDKNKNNKIDSEDFKLLRGKKTETKESLKGGQKKLDANKNNKIDAEDFKLLKKKGKKETLKLSEAELVDLIESIVKEDLKTIGGKPRGLSEYERSHKGSGKENDEYIKSVTKKMKEYLKDGSKGEYTESPKYFPKSNGQIEKMDTKKYTMSKDGDEFIDDFLRPGMENLEYDEIQPNEEWMEGNIEGSSKTGNNPKWANAEETELGKKLNKKRKDNKFAKLRNKSYNKAKQPITDRPGDEDGNGINIKLESTEKETKVLNEEFTKIQHLMGYSRKTQ